jgi:hypothetical protein
MAIFPSILLIKKKKSFYFQFLMNWKRNSTYPESKQTIIFGTPTKARKSESNNYNTNHFWSSSQEVKVFAYHQPHAITHQTKPKKKKKESKLWQT